ncbi:glycoside hydrolase family 95 protein [Cyathus striatus]|nr:glycoside hydrolase family 95 protein [Cyathus striatus]
MLTAKFILALAHLLPLTRSAPQGFPASGNGLWYTAPGDVWSREWLPIGNGYLAAMTPGGTVQETAQLNIESLWSGGPFADPTYNGGNKQPSERVATANTMQQIRQTIFSSPTGDIDNIEELATDAGQYGSYAGAGHLLSTLNVTGAVSSYARWLDLDTAVAKTSWTQAGSAFQRTTFCSHPTQTCTQHLTSTHTLPTLTFAFSSVIEGLPAPNITCNGKDTLIVRGQVSTNPPSMVYELIFKLFPGSSGQSQCIQFPVPSGAAPNGTLSLVGGTSKEAYVTWVGGTNFSQDKGTSKDGYSFNGPDPHNALLALISTPRVLNGGFSLDLGQKPQLSLSTDQLKAKYLEWVLFNYGRYMLFSSARGTLPANLQGKWADGVGNAWSADYHSNINIQMNYWSAESTNLDVSSSLFDYFEKNWVPRGEYTAQVLYNISRGWVVHDEIFGHTGMKGGGNTAQWSNYPDVHVWDHFDFTNDVAWWKKQGWPLLKGVAQFHLDKLIPDLHFNDSSLVVNPCNSPEQVPITFGCAHAQQIIWQLFNAVEKGFAASGDTDTEFLAEVGQKKAQMDKGYISEWKVDRDSQTDTHRHLSHLIGLYPGYAVASYDSSVQGQEGYTKSDVLAAASVSLTARGNGTGPDADSGWEKAWRAAAWAQLGNKDMFYHELSYAIFENFGDNLFSFPIFQIDANLGYPGAVMNSLIQAPDVANISTPLAITLLPALPSQWPSGFIKGTRVRGGITLDLSWASGKPTSAQFKVDNSIVSRQVQVVYGGKVVSEFKTAPGFMKSLNHFG